MKPEEIRIGNWVSDRGGEFKLSDHEVFNDSFDPEVLAGIPITEEWLERLGLNKIGTEYKANNSKFSLRAWFNINNKPVITLDYAGIGHIEYVHQLQNLYFSLTGQELTIKEKV
jgi:hypothetical protein